MSTIDAFTLPATLGRRLAAVGVELAALLREAGLPGTLLALIEHSQARVSTAEFFALWEALERLNDDPCLGLRLTEAVAPQELDVVSLAALHAANFGESIAQLARYKRLCFPEELQVSRQGAEVSLAFHWHLAPTRPPARLIDACFGTVLAVARAGSGLPVRPLRVEFARPPAEPARFEAHFGCTVRFDAAADRMVFADETLALPFRTADSDLLAMLLPGLEMALARLPDRPPANAFVDQVRKAIRRQMQGRRALVDRIAGSLALSPRSLQRRLADEGTSFQRLLDEVRHEVARELLVTTSLDHGEIAFLLGFEEVNSFNRAFAGWEGVSPRRWRQRAEPVARRHALAPAMAARPPQPSRKKVSA